MMTSKKQAFYYYIGKQNVDNFKVKITLRKVLSRPTVETQTSFQKQSFKDVKTYVVWQEKVLGPQDRINRLKRKCLVDPTSRIREKRDNCCTNGA